MNCSVAQSLDVVGEWWSLLIVRDVFNGIRRFEALRMHLGVSKNVLSDRLKHLVSQEILRQERYQDNPDRYEYCLTDRGEELFPILAAIMAWGDRWLNANDSPPAQLVHTVCGQVTRPKLVCEHCQMEITASDFEFRPGPGATPEHLDLFSRAIEKS